MNMDMIDELELFCRETLSEASDEEDTGCSGGGGCASRSLSPHRKEFCAAVVKKQNHAKTPPMGSVTNPGLAAALGLPAYTHFQVVGQSRASVYAHPHAPDRVIKIIKNSEQRRGKPCVEFDSIAEILFWRRLQHALPHCYHTRSVAEITPTHVAITMEHMQDSRSLISTCKNTQAECMTAFATMVVDLLAQLALIHQSGMCHGDVKTSNVMWHFKHQMFTFVDFGLSSVLPCHTGRDKAIITESLRTKEVRNVLDMPGLMVNGVDVASEDVFCLGYTIAHLMFQTRMWRFMGMPMLPDMNFQCKSLSMHEKFCNAVRRTSPTRDIPHEYVALLRIVKHMLEPKCKKRMSALALLQTKPFRVLLACSNTNAKQRFVFAHTRLMEASFMRRAADETRGRQYDRLSWWQGWHSYYPVWARECAEHARRACEFVETRLGARLKTHDIDAAMYIAMARCATSINFAAIRTLQWGFESPRAMSMRKFLTGEWQDAFHVPF